MNSDMVDMKPMVSDVMMKRKKWTYTHRQQIYIWPVSHSLSLGKTLLLIRTISEPSEGHSANRIVWNCGSFPFDDPNGIFILIDRFKEQRRRHDHLIW